MPSTAKPRHSGNESQNLSLTVHEDFLHFIENDVLPLVAVDGPTFWRELDRLLHDLAPENRALLARRDELQAQIDQWHKDHHYSTDTFSAYKKFLEQIGYLHPKPHEFKITTEEIDPEISKIAGPQLVVPLKNARFALNAANARWGSLYDALYGTDVIPRSTQTEHGYDKHRGAQVIAYAREFLDEIFPLTVGSHRDAVNYQVYYRHFFVTLSDGSCAGLKKPDQFIGHIGAQSEPSALLLKNNGLHVELQIDPSSPIGKDDPASIADIEIESAVTTIMDCEDSVACVDAEDKVAMYRNWLGLMQGDLTETFTKGNEKITRQLAADRIYTARDCHAEDNTYTVPGRSLMFIRNVGHLMTTDVIRDKAGQEVPEGILDGVVTALISIIDLNKNSGLRNSREGSIYIVKPKMHGPEEVAFTCTLFDRIEDMLTLPRHTLKLGIMDEERRTTINLHACIEAAKSRVVFINTGFLDRTGDEIHTSMHAGAFLPKDQIKTQPWIAAYEDWNVDTGLAVGFQNRAQIGKGMWAMPDEMSKMMEEKIAHPYAGANTAWVPSPTAATLHAMHYHRVDVAEVQASLAERAPASLDDILTIPLLEPGVELDPQLIERELENNAQGILGYVVRWIDAGVGCSKVPDINNVGLMEDRATLRISSQHIANWLRHKICTAAQVTAVMQRMAVVVDQQNSEDPEYIKMASDFDKSIAFQAALDLIFKGEDQPSGYTEPLLHAYRIKAKAR